MVHQISTDVSVEVVGAARTFRGPGAYARGEQIVSAALSVTSNIAEACGRNTIQEFRQFLGYAKGSAFEVQTQLRIARKGTDHGGQVLEISVEVRGIEPLSLGDRSGLLRAQPVVDLASRLPPAEDLSASPGSLSGGGPRTEPPP